MRKKSSSKGMQEEVDKLRQRVKELEGVRCHTWDDTLKLLILDTTPFTVWACDKDFRIVLWNRRCEDVYGFSQSEAVGKSFVDLFVDEPEQEEAMKDCIDIIEKGVICQNYLAYDNNRQKQRRTMLTNCFRIWDAKSNAYLQAEVGLQIDDLDLRRHKHQTLREVGIERRKDASLKCESKKKELEARVNAACKDKEYTLLKNQIECERWERELNSSGIAANTNKLAEIKTKLAREELSIQNRSLDLQRLILTSSSLNSLAELELRVSEFERQDSSLRIEEVDDHRPHA